MSDTTTKGVRRKTDAIAVIAACALFMESLDATAIVPAFPQMAASFGTEAVALSVGISAYLIAMAIFIPASAWAAERFGTRKVFSVAIIGFTVSSVMCGLSTSLDQFTLARCLQGMSAAMMSPVARLEVLRRADKSDLMRAIALTTGIGLTAFAVGPPIGGVLTTYLSWRWIFFLNVPIGIVGVILVLTHFDRTVSASARRFEVRGFALTGGALALLLYSIEQIGRGGTLLTTVIPFCTGLLLGGMALRHARTATNPFLSIAPISVRTFRDCMIQAASLFRLQYGSASFLIPLMLQLGFGRSSFETGLLVAVLLSGDLTAKLYVNQLLRSFGFRGTLLAAGGAVILSTLGLAVISPSAPDALLLPLLFAVGSTRSIVFSGLNVLSFADISREQLPAASTLMSMAQQLAIAGGVSAGALLLTMSSSFQDASDILPLTGFRLAIVLSLLPTVPGMLILLRLSPKDGAELGGFRKV